MKKGIFFTAAALLLASFIINPHHAQAADPQPAAAQDPHKAELRQRGGELRAAIDNEYDKITYDHTLKTEGENDITPAVAKFIPPGTSFDDAELILRGASFKVSPRPDAGNPKTLQADPAYKDSVMATINPYKDLLIGTVHVTVYLTPAAPGDYSKVSAVHAGLAGEMKQ